MAVHDLFRLIGLSERAMDRMEWQAIEAEFGALPADYKAFCDASSGAGCIGEFFWIFDPFTTNANLNLRSHLFQLPDYLRRLRNPPPSFPASGGLLPFGMTTNGDLLHWRTCPEPDKWTVSISVPRASKMIEFHGGMTEWLLAVLSGSITVAEFPKGIGKLYPPLFRCC